MAEGSKRKSRRGFARFPNLAEASLAGAEDLLLLSRDLDYLTQEPALPLEQEVTEIARMLPSLRDEVQRGASPS